MPPVTARHQRPDYTATSGTLNWADGDSSGKTFSVMINDDAEAEFTETVNLSLSNPTGGACLGSQDTAQIRINDNDGGAAIPTITEWGMILLSLMLGGFAIWYMRKQPHSGQIT